MQPVSTNDPVTKGCPSPSGLDRIGAVLGDIQIAHTVFALPFALASAHLAFQLVGGYKLSTLLAILVCMVTARTGAMSFNRFLDRKLDSENPRTGNRSIPSGRAKPLDALAVVIVCSMIFIAACWFLGPLPLILSIPTLAFLLGYSWSKRYTVLTHLWLGSALAIAPAGAWIAIMGILTWPPVILSLAVAGWVAGFDVIYSLQDIEFDKANRVFSVPARFGTVAALWIAKFLHLASFAFLLIFGTVMQLGWPYFAALAIAGIVLIIEHMMVRPNDFSRVGIAFFTMNGIISILIYIGVLLSTAPIISHVYGVGL